MTNTATAPTLETERYSLTRDQVYARRVWAGTHYDRDRAGRPQWSYRVIAELHRLGLQAPYFSLQYEQIHRATRSLRSCGASDEEITRLAPAAAPFLRWHLTSPAGPMHYRANGLFWAGFTERDGKIARAILRQPAYPGDRQPPDWPAFASTIVLGAVDGDPDTATLANYSGDSLAQWLDDRRPALQAAFRADMDRVFADNLDGVAAAFAYDEAAARARYAELSKP